MSILERVRRYAEDYRERRRRIQTERMIRDLPAELRKDIGWPGASDVRRRRQ